MHATVNLTRKALRSLAGVDSLSPLQRHVRLLVSQATLDGALECCFVEGTFPYDALETEKQRETAFMLWLITRLAEEVTRRRFPYYAPTDAEWSAAWSPARNGVAL